MKSLITGIDGYIGTWLSNILREKGDNVSGISLHNEGVFDSVKKFKGDIENRKFVDSVITEIKPDRIFHLAALNNITDSIKNPHKSISVNVLGSLNLLESIRDKNINTSFISIGTSAEYGKTADLNKPLTEEDALLPTSPYGISKTCQGHLCQFYTSAFGTNVIHVRPFAIIGPFKERDALSDFCKEVVKIEKGLKDSFSVGNLESYRDFVDIRDFIDALIIISEKGHSGEIYNICNGNTSNLYEIISILKSLSRKSFDIVVDNKRLRNIDNSFIIGNPNKLFKLGYEPKYQLKDTIEFTLNYWRNKQNL